METANGTIALNETQDDVGEGGGHATAPNPVLAILALGCALLAPLQGLVNLDHATSTAHRREVARTHRFADAMAHEPSRLEGDAQHPVKLVGANSLLAGTQERNSLQPHPHGDMAVLEDGPDLHGEGLAAVLALVGANAGGLALQLGHALAPMAAGALRTMRPQMGFHPVVGGLFVLKALVRYHVGHGTCLLRPPT
jgi:hypothetical protein